MMMMIMMMMMMMELTLLSEHIPLRWGLCEFLALQDAKQSGLNVQSKDYPVSIGST